MNRGDKVEVINPKRGHFGLTGKIVSRTLLEFGVAIRDRVGRHLGGGMYEAGELKLIEEGQSVTATMTEQEYFALDEREKDTVVAALAVGLNVERAQGIQEVYVWPNTLRTTYIDKGQPMVVFADGAALTVPPYTTEMGTAWRLTAKVYELPFSQRQTFFMALSELVRKRLNVPVAWPDLLLYLTPADLCFAALKAKGAIA